MRNDAISLVTVRMSTNLVGLGSTVHLLSQQLTLLRTQPEWKHKICDQDEFKTAPNVIMKIKQLKAGSWWIGTELRI